VILTAFESIDWADAAVQVSKHLCVQEIIGLPSWSRLATADDGLTSAVQQALFDFATGPVDELLDILGLRARVDCFYRPPAYNALPSIGGAPGSAHQALGPWAAIDWKPIAPTGQILSCDAIRQRILDDQLLDKIGLRMEDRPGSSWIHNDNHPVGTARFFVP
jgi:hypothetical protein